MQSVLHCSADSLTYGIGTLQKRLDAAMQHVVDILRGSTSFHKISTFVCPSCGYTFSYPCEPVGCTLCHYTYNSRFHRKACIADTRILSYYETLRENGTWSFIFPAKDVSVSDLLSRISDMNIKNEHICDGEDKCPLKKELNVLVEKAQAIVQGASGLPLHPLHGDCDC